MQSLEGFPQGVFRRCRVWGSKSRQASTAGSRVITFTRGGFCGFECGLSGSHSFALSTDTKVPSNRLGYLAVRSLVLRLELMSSRSGLGPKVGTVT